MKTLLFVLAAAMLLTVAVPTHGRTLGPPVGAVRPVSVEGERYCSAVVIKPGVALTAGHCLKRGMEVDGRKPERVTTSVGTKDIAVLTVPGLKCPCVPMGVRPAKGDQVLAVGYPVDRAPERIVSPVARVSHVGELKVVMPDFPDQGYAREHYIITDAPIINHGDSGGALFSMQNGHWRVVGINAIGIPDPSTCTPWGCAKETGSGFVPVDVARKFL